SRTHLLHHPATGRAAHTATLLADGRVLVVGGCATDGCTTADGVPDSEYYVPGQGFTAGPALEQPRQGHSATLLADGRVLIVGGWAREGAAPLDAAEVFEPRTGRFEPVGSLSVGRGGHSAAKLPDGRVLIAGGDTDTAELFDPQRNVFIPAAPMPEPRFAAPATTLVDGRVLIVGGRDAAGRAMASAVIYDPASDSWQATGAMSTPRDKHELALLPDGRVLVMGGTPDDRTLLSTTEIYDPGPDSSARDHQWMSNDTSAWRWSAPTAAWSSPVAAKRPSTTRGHPPAGSTRSAKRRRRCVGRRP
ncbi:MAG: hypothetical protein IRY85_21615, partial [Micromonosporaceae bacterium]|nr:hypothetical protein [Micromonosporaceae bacterium]